MGAESPDSYLIKELNAMINDADRDNNYLLLPEDTILEERYTWKKATASEATPSKALASDADWGNIQKNSSVCCGIWIIVRKHKVNHTPIA